MDTTTHAVRTEGDWQRVVVALARINGWSASTSYGPHSDSGFPDLVLWRDDGRVLFVELKTDVGHVRPEQRSVHTALRRGGHEVYVWRPVDRALVERELNGGEVSHGERVGTLPERGLSIATIKLIVSDAAGIDADELAGRARTQRVAWVRQVAMTMCRELTPATLVEIGRAFNREHTTCLHAVREVRRRVDTDPSCALFVARCRQLLLTAESPQSRAA